MEVSFVPRAPLSEERDSPVNARRSFPPPPKTGGFLVLIPVLIAAALALAGCGTRPIGAGAVNFDEVNPGQLPPGWLGGVTGPGQARWAVEEDATAPSPPNVLKQSGEAKFCWCVRTNLSLQDGFVEVKFKPVSGKEDQAGGLVWRWQDGDNYYVARANALEDNVTIYHTIHGVRTEEGRAPFKVASNQWHILRVDFHGPRFTVRFDGQPALSWEDATFRNAGAAGVWTKADSVTEFDDFRWGN
jgi:hypothetical protein